MRWFVRLLEGGVVLAVGSLLTGCADATDPQDSQLAADGNQAMVASAQSTSLSTLVLDAVQSVAPAAAAQDLLSPARLWPWMCATRTADTWNADLVHLSLAGCAGPFALLEIDGTEEVSFSAGSSGAVVATLHNASLSAADRALAYEASLDITSPSAPQLRVIWQGSWSRVDDDGDAISHDADLEILFDRTTECRTANGTAASVVAGRELDTVMTDYRICRNLTTGVEGCPTGSVVHTGMPSGATVTTTYDGSNVAHVTGSKGDGFSLSLACGT